MTTSVLNLVKLPQMAQRVFSRGVSIPPRKDVLWRIEHGVVRTITWSEEGTVIPLGYWGPGDVVGHPLSRLSPYQIECLTRTKMSILPKPLWYQASDAIVLHIQQAEELLNIVHLNPVSLRLWQFLVWLGDRFGRDVDQGRLIDLGLTQQELAEAIGATRVTVTRLLGQYESEGKLERYQRQLLLCSNQGMTALRGHQGRCRVIAI